MLRSLASALVLLAAAATAQAHFLFVVPDPGNASARIMFSETLQPDTDVDINLAAGAKLSVRGIDDGAAHDLKLAAGEHVLNTDLPGTGNRLVHGTADLGVMERGSKPHRLIYHPKTIVGDAFEPRAVLGEAVPVELVPVRQDSQVKLELRVGGKPQADAEVAIINAQGEETRVKTDAAGHTPALASAGRFGAWARHWQDQSGAHNGKAYEQVRHYATIVFDVPEATAAGQTASGVPTAERAAQRARALSQRGGVAAIVETYPTTLPEATSSFGAVAIDGWLYVYGGHIVPTHNYSTAAVSGRFFRLDLTDGATWQELPGGPALQGMNLAAHAGQVYRVGGMNPRNAPGEPADVHSVADVARYNPADRAWHALPSLPEPRSSHDLVVVGNTLYVIGGWTLSGGIADATHSTTMLSLDLSAENAQWVEHSQPFTRRAIIAAVHDGKIFVLGGFDEEDRPSRRVDIFDPRTATWSTGPGLIGPAINGFAPAACVHEGRLYVSVGDGTLSWLNDADYVWEEAARTTPRIVHRLVPVGSRILVLGGAAKGQNFDLIEAVSIQPSAAPTAAAPHGARRPAKAQPTASPAPAAAAPAAPATQPAGDAAAAQLFCPVMTDEPVNASSIVVQYQGKPVRLCCKTCLKKWNADPERYANPTLLPQLAATPGQ